MDVNINKIKSLLGNKFRENEPLSSHTTFRIGGPARYFVLTQSSDSLQEVLSWAQKNKILVSSEFRARWTDYGKRAGPIRNQLMLNQKPNAVIAFPGNTGTANMTSIARKAGIKVYDGSSLEW